MTKKRQTSRDQAVIDAGLNIFQDSKRRTLYYFSANHTAYQYESKDQKWIKIYELRLVISAISYFLAYLIVTSQVLQRFRSLAALAVGLIIYLIIRIGFERFLIQSLIPLKMKEKDLEIFNNLEVLKQKRSLLRYQMAFIFLYGLIAVLDLVNLQGVHWIWLVICGLITAAILLPQALAYRQIANKIKAQKEEK